MKENTLEKKDMVCIVCPVGCRMTLEYNPENLGSTEDFIVSGNKCNRGKAYALKEMTAPTRMLPTTVKIRAGILKRLPVRTEQPVPKELIFDCMQVINQIEVEAPIKVGDVVLANILGTGVNIIATRSMGRAK